ncbi:MAG: hypothetical protein KDD62_10000, partial [Bdellovibrionales bacterium]|nr:hypothetical protein [Bdellovibrionales bacterium]
MNHQPFQLTSVSSPSRLEPISSACFQDSFLSSKKTLNFAQQLNDQLSETLRTSGPPDWLIDELRLVDQNSASGQAFAAAITAILQKLEPKWDPEKYPLSIYLADHKNLNAYHLRPTSGTTPRPIMVLHKGCFENSFRTPLDLAVSIIGHEGIHIVAKHRYPDRNNSRAEEFLADVLPLERVYLAGFDPTAAREHWKASQANARDELSKLDVIYRAMDVHPSSASRISGQDLALVRLFSKVG